jgi:2-dehydropantoate 2-reductase
MPGVAGHVDEHGLVRYWTSALQPTRIDTGSRDPATRAAVERLARRLDAAELPTALDEDVARKNAATTVAFFPLIASIAPGHGLEGVLADEELLTTTLAALRETSALAPKLGPQQPFARWIARFASPGSLAAAVAIVRIMAPDVLHFLDAHFGPKLHDQHVAMGAAVLSLAREHDVATPALERLMDRVREVSAA